MLHWIKDDECTYRDLTLNGHLSLYRVNRHSPVISGTRGQKDRHARAKQHLVLEEACEQCVTMSAPYAESRLIIRRFSIVPRFLYRTSDSLHPGSITDSLLSATPADDLPLQLAGPFASV